MVWRSNGPAGSEAQKIGFDIVHYLHGRVLDLGCGGRKVFPGKHIIGIDNNIDAKLFGMPARLILIHLNRRLGLIGGIRWNRVNIGRLWCFSRNICFRPRAIARPWRMRWKDDFRSWIIGWWTSAMPCRRT